MDANLNQSLEGGGSGTLNGGGTSGLDTPKAECSQKSLRYVECSSGGFVYQS